MGVTGTRGAVSGNASELVARIKKETNTPVAVGLGVSNGTQAREVAQYADGVIVGSAFIKKIQEAKNFKKALKDLTSLAEELAKGVRR